MKIISINLENHYILGNLFLDFTNENDEPCDTIIIAGENGCGKTSILDLIFNFSDFEPMEIPRGKVEIEIEVSDEEFKSLKSAHYISWSLPESIKKNRIKFIYDMHDKKETGWNTVFGQWVKSNGEIEQLDGVNWKKKEFVEILNTVYVDSEINYKSSVIKSVTAKKLDEVMDKSIRMSNYKISDIKQLFIDIDSLDNNDIAHWVRNNVGKIPPSEILHARIDRFNHAFLSIFQNKKISRVSNEKENKEVYFIENGNEMRIEELSSGEKQIVFRAGNYLKNRDSINEQIVLIDEPEISLHPTWQMNIVPFYQKLVSGGKEQQKVQLFVATHSPFVIHNKNRINDKVIILKKNEDGIIVRDNKFFSWTEEKLVSEAFNLHGIFGKINQSTKAHLIITEGQTDWKHLKAAYEKLKEQKMFDRELYFLEYDSSVNMGDESLKHLCEEYSKIPNDRKVICVFDRDNPKIVKKIDENGLKMWGNEVYSFAIPIPDHRVETPNISIEHYYTDKEIMTKDEQGRRLYMGNEFVENQGIHKSEELFCPLKTKIGPASIAIIDDKVQTFRDKKNCALPKEDFASNILNKMDGFEKHSYEAFLPIFQVINQILEEG